MNPPNNSQKNWLSFLDTKKRHPDLQGCMPRPAVSLCAWFARSSRIYLYLIKKTHEAKLLRESFFVGLHLNRSCEVVVPFVAVEGQALGTAEL